MSEEIFQFLERKPQFICDINPYLRCKLCSDVMINASYLPCGCEFCNKCIYDYLQSGNTNCPVANEECCNVTVTIKDIMRNLPTINKINKLIVRCTNPNCHYQDNVINVVHHLETCVINPMFKCYSETDDEDDEDGEDVGNMVMIEKQNNKLNILTHFNTNLKKRLSQVEEEKVHVDTENKELKKNLNLRDWEIERITQENEFLKSESKRMRITNSEIKSKIEKSEKENENLLEENENIKKIIREFDVQKNLMGSEHVERKMGVESKNLSPFSWIVEGIEEKKKGRDALWSPEFYSDEGGYKMQVKIKFKGPCLPVGFYGRILIGPNDDDLIWPCTKSIRIRVMGGKIFKKCLVKFHGPAACRPDKLENPTRWGDMIKASDFYSAIKNNQILIICQVV